MKKTILFAIVAIVLISACQPSEADIERAIAETEAARPTNTIIPPTPTNTPVCKEDVCIKDVHVLIDQQNIQISFDLTNMNGESLVGEELAFSGDQMVGLYLLDGDEETYLSGAIYPDTVYLCYSGNDLPWSFGNYLSTCGFVQPISGLQVRPKVGDIVRVENKTFDYIQVLEIENRE
jgi:hypothetical protein